MGKTENANRKPTYHTIGRELLPDGTLGFFEELAMKQAKCLTLDEWSSMLASSAPAPGGGGAVALLGVLAACLASMVGHLTLGKKGYEHFDVQCAGLNEQALLLKDELLALIDEDAALFNSLMQAWKRGATDEDYLAACGASIRTVSAVLRVLDILEQLEVHGNKNVLSDVGIGARCAESALLGSRINILVNARLIQSAGVRKTLDVVLDSDIPHGALRARHIAWRVEKELACE